MGKRTKKDNDNYSRCRRTQCGYFLKGGCKACAKCKAEPYKINPDCTACYACENIAGSLRWGDANKQLVAQMKKIDVLLAIRDAIDDMLIELGYEEEVEAEEEQIMIIKR